MRTTNHSSAFWFFSDSWVLIIRSFKHIFKNVDQMLGLVMQPLMFMLLFRYVFGGAIDTGGVSYVNYLMAGIIVQTAAFGATTTSMNVALDLKRGIVDRFRSLPMSNAALLIGHVTADLVRNMISTVIMVLVGLLVGFRPDATVQEWILATGVLMLFTFAISWFSAVLGLVVKSVEAVMWVGFMVVFPLTFASSAFVPTESMPAALRIFAENQPVTHTINALRGYTVGTPVGDDQLKDGAAQLWTWIKERVRNHHGIWKRNTGYYLKELEWKYNNRALHPDLQARKIIAMMPMDFLTSWSLSTTKRLGKSN